MKRKRHSSEHIRRLCQSDAELLDWIRACALSRLLVSPAAQARTLYKLGEASRKTFDDYMCWMRPDIVCNLELISRSIGKQAFSGPRSIFPLIVSSEMRHSMYRSQCASVDSFATGRSSSRDN